MTNVNHHETKKNSLKHHGWIEVLAFISTLLSWAMPLSAQVLTKSAYNWSHHAMSDCRVSSGCQWTCNSRSNWGEEREWKHQYCQTSNTSQIKSQNLNDFHLVLHLSLPNLLKPGLSREWRCSWSSADKRCSNYIWVVNNLIAYKDEPYIRDLTVHLSDQQFYCLLRCILY